MGQIGELTPSIWTHEGKDTSTLGIPASKIPRKASGIFDDDEQQQARYYQPQQLIEN